ncbi:helix-turn-helix domain-containing protein [Saccharothrix hoggarensis]|uniref:Helix-turn-helix domain-containing protein n=1 Tax=Saccharothrix hoggarensis TaxID=913853 RepID=A0ABW3QSW7_9PSEU
MTTDESADSTWWQWLERALEDRGMTPAQLSKLTKIDRSAHTRWRNGERPTFDTVRVIAKALGVSPVEVAVAANLLTAEEAALEAPSPDPAVLTDQQLLAELGRRLKRKT